MKVEPYRRHTPVGKTFTIRLSERQLRETLKALRAADVDPKIRDEVTQKLGAAYVNGDDRTIISHDKRNDKRNKAADDEADLRLT